MKQQILIENQHLEIIDKGEGNQAIVILPGMFCSFEEWLPIIDNLSNFTRVISFHRPGYGKSELGNKEKTTQSVCTLLLRLLDTLDIFEPIVLVGHSYGGLCVQHFMKLYPKRVNSAVLVDSSSVNLHRLDALRLPISGDSDSDEYWVAKCHSYSVMDKEKLKETLNPTLSPYQKQLPLESQKSLLEFITTPSAYGAMMLEIQNWKECAKKIKKIQNNFDKPVKIIGRDKIYSIKKSVLDGMPIYEAAQIEWTWEELIYEQANLFVNSELVFACNTGHSIHIDNPELITKTIMELTSIY